MDLDVLGKKTKKRARKIKEGGCIFIHYVRSDLEFLLKNRRIRRSVISLYLKAVKM